MSFLVSGKIEFLCLFAIKDEVTGKKSSDLRGNRDREGFQNMACSQVLYYLHNSRILLANLELQRNDV